MTTRRMLDLIDASPTPYHAVAAIVSRLDESGFQTLSELDPWTVVPGGRYVIERNGSSVIALEVGQEPPPRSGFRLVGAHTDSPNIRLKPRPAYAAEGYRQLGVEVYGGVLLSTWMDRDLTLAGRVCVAGEDRPRLLRFDRPLCRIPNLAIHLDREVNTTGLVLNPQNHLPPVIGLEGDPADPDWFPRLLAGALDVDPGSIRSFDLMLADAQPSTLAGVDREFVCAPRLDNLASCHAALEALLTAGRPAGASRGFVLYDHEEVGSESAQGAASTFLQATLDRVVEALGGSREDLHRALRGSLFVSADMAHAVHPNRTDRHEPRHLPRLNRGPVIKVNSNQRYATDPVTSSRFLEIAGEVEEPVQVFVVRSDLPCGSTIGPITATRLGIPTVDVGNPMLSMHSAREMAGSRDQESIIRILTRFYER